MNKKYIFIIFLFLFILTFILYFQHSKDKNINNKASFNKVDNLKNEAITTYIIEESTEITSKIINPKKTIQNTTYEGLYNNFLNGDATVLYNNKNLNIYQLTENINKNIDYAFFDMNNDNIPELHIKCPWFYLIITISNNELKFWKDASVYETPLNNKALFYERHGGAPTHISYQYTTLDYNGKDLFNISFSKYDANMDDIYDEKDKYFINDSEVSKAYWDNETKKYFIIKNDLIKWTTFKINP